MADNNAVHTEDGIVRSQMEIQIAVPGDGTRSAIEMPAIASDDRRKLRDAIIAYADGTIRTYAFDDINNECMDSHDPSVRQVSKLLYQIHDDIIDRPISVTKTTWDALIRIVAFLDTDLTADDNVDNNSWPFKDEDVWNAHRSSMGETGMPAYDAGIHALRVHGPFNRIPTLIGSGMIAAATALLVVFMLIATR